MASNDDYEATYHSRNSLRKIAMNRKISGARKLSSKGDCIAALRKNDAQNHDALPIMGQGATIDHSSQLATAPNNAFFTAPPQQATSRVLNPTEGTADAKLTNPSFAAAPNQAVTQPSQSHPSDNYDNQGIHKLRKLCQQRGAEQWWSMRREQAIALLRGIDGNGELVGNIDGELEDETAQASSRGVHGRKENRSVVGEDMNDEATLPQRKKGKSKLHNDHAGENGAEASALRGSPEKEETLSAQPNQS